MMFLGFKKHPKSIENNRFEKTFKITKIQKKNSVQIQYMNEVYTKVKNNNIP